MCDVGYNLYVWWAGVTAARRQKQPEVEAKS